MINLDNISLLEVLPDSLRKNDENKAISAALTAVIKKINEDTKVLNLEKDIPDHLLDTFAYEEHVDFYDPSLSVEQKKQLINESYFFHQKKGTPAAVERLIEIIFGEGKVEEWFEYGGEPGYFKVITSNKLVTEELAEEFRKTLESIKRKSAWLEKVEVTQTESMNLYAGGFIHIGDKLTLEQVI